MDNDRGTRLAEGTEIFDPGHDMTFEAGETSGQETPGRFENGLSYLGAAGVAGASGSSGNGASNVAAEAAAASGLADDRLDDEADNMGELSSLDSAPLQETGPQTGSRESRHDGEVPVPARRDWLHETGLHGEEAAAELGSLPAIRTVGTVSPLTGPAAAETTRSNAGEAADRRASAVQTAGSALGWTALLFAVASLFIWPLLMGATAAVLGYMAYRQGSHSLGVWSMTIGVVAAAAYFLLAPMYAALA